MINFKFRELLFEKERQIGRRIPLREVSEATGISVQVLSSLASERPEIVTNTAFIESVCRYLGCQPGDIMQLDSELSNEGVCHVDQLYSNRRRS